MSAPAPPTVILKPEEHRGRTKLKYKLAHEPSAKTLLKSEKEIFIKKPKVQINANNIVKTILLWKARWKNKMWRQKWKYTWGYKRWRPSIRKQWKKNKKWRRGWMKKIRINWWDKKWRRKWIKHFIDSRWLRRWHYKRQRRQELWKRRWIKSGAKMMGLSFNEFLLIERRQRILKKKQPRIAVRRRVERRMLRAKRIQEQLEQRAVNEQKKCLIAKWFGRFAGKDVLGPECFGIRHHAIQYNLYGFNLIQGIISMGLVVKNLLVVRNRLPAGFHINGFHIILIMAASFDIVGSAFGMITSYHLDNYYGGDIDYIGKTTCGFQKKTNKVTNSFKPHASRSTKKRKHRRNTNASSDSRHSKKQSKAAKIFEEKYGEQKEQEEVKKKSDDKERSPRGFPLKRNPSEHKEVAPGTSRTCINLTGYLSWIMLELAWFLFVFVVTYYKWLEKYSPGYQQISAQCEVSPNPGYCDDFEEVYNYLIIVAVVTFITRSILVFIIGLFFRERYLKRYVSNDPFDEDLVSTCSDTDIDYTQVPKDILIPHLLSGGKYPYVLPGHSRPVDYIKDQITKVMEKNREAPVPEEDKKKKHKKRRILSTYDREAVKIKNMFKQARRVNVVMEKGKRRPMEIPVPAGVTDTFQLPPELMTDKAWAWLRADEESTTDNERQEQCPKRATRSTVKWRSSRKRKVKPVDSDTLTLLDKKDPLLTLTAQEIVKNKLKDIDVNVKDSTDDSWSENEVKMFEKNPHFQEDRAEEEEVDFYLNLFDMSQRLTIASQKFNK